MHLLCIFFCLSALQLCSILAVELQPPLSSQLNLETMKIDFVYGCALGDYITVGKLINDPFFAENAPESTRSHGLYAALRSALDGNSNAVLVAMSLLFRPEFRTLSAADPALVEQVFIQVCTQGLIPLASGLLQVEGIDFASLLGEALGKAAESGQWNVADILIVSPRAQNAVWNTQEAGFILHYALEDGAYDPALHTFHVYATFFKKSLTDFQFLVVIETALGLSQEYGHIAALLNTLIVDIHRFAPLAPSLPHDELPRVYEVLSAIEGIKVSRLDASGRWLPDELWNMIYKKRIQEIISGIMRGLAAPAPPPMPAPAPAPVPAPVHPAGPFAPNPQHNDN